MAFGEGVRYWGGVRLVVRRCQVKVGSPLNRSWRKREIRAELMIRNDHPILRTRLTQSMMIALRPAKITHRLSTDVRRLQNIPMTPASHFMTAVGRPKGTKMVDRQVQITLRLVKIDKAEGKLSSGCVTKCWAGRGVVPRRPGRLTPTGSMLDGKRVGVSIPDEIRAAPARSAQVQIKSKPWQPASASPVFAVGLGDGIGQFDGVVPGRGGLVGPIDHIGLNQ